MSLTQFRALPYAAEGQRRHVQQAPLHQNRRSRDVCQQAVSLFKVWNKKVRTGGLVSTAVMKLKFKIIEVYVFALVIFQNINGK